MLLAEVAEWQTRRTQNPVSRKARVGSTPTFGTCDRMRIKPTGSVKTPSFTAQSPSSASAHETRLSRQNPTDPDPIRPSTATKIATGLRQRHVIDAEPDLAAVVDAWPNLPEAIRAGILAMVQAASGSGYHKS